VLQLTKAVAIAPYKQHVTAFNFCAETSRAPQKVDSKTMQGLLGVWRKHLSSVKGVSESMCVHVSLSLPACSPTSICPVSTQLASLMRKSHARPGCTCRAEVIIQRHKSPRALLQHLQAHGRLALAEMQLRRAPGLAARRLGDVVSARLHALYLSDDAEQLVE